jgi:FHS family L-fucose permease-like MFS transporter
MTKNKGLFPFILITSLFFFWGFAHNLDPILIPHLKKSFTLTTVEATLVDSAVFIAYFLMALPAGFIMKKYGYKTGIITGLLVFAFGSYLFIPAANTQQYAFFLVALIYHCLRTDHFRNSRQSVCFLTRRSGNRYTKA